MVFSLLFIIAAFYSLDIHQIDIKTVFFDKKINQLVFIKMLNGYYNNIKNMICRVNKIFYGLKQLSQLWYK